MSEAAAPRPAWRPSAPAPWRWLARLWPRGLAFQFAILLVVALVAANAVALTVLSSERDRIMREARRGAEIDRFVALVGALAQVPPGQREQLARATSSPFLRLAVEPRPAVAAGAADVVSRRVARLVAAGLAEVELGDAQVRVQPGDGPPPPRRDKGGSRGDGDGRHRPWRRIYGLELSVRLPDGMWVNAAARRPDGPAAGLGRAVVVPLSLSLVAVLGVGVWFIRRLTRPVRALAEAAERAGTGDRAARVPPAGAGEVRRAAEAFNLMQERIARFEAERARTIAAVGHDLRTPITSLRIRAEMLDDDEREAMVKTLDEMRVIADGLLAYGHAGAAVEGMQRLDLAALVAELAGGTVRYEGPARFPFEGRPVALRRALGNLVENARRYAGGAVLRAVPERRAVVVTVEDRGPGIPEDRLADVLEPFVRLEGSRSSETGGAGLGLAIARTLVSVHGGTLSLANREGGGLVATVRLPTAG